MAPATPPALLQVVLHQQRCSARCRGLLAGTRSKRQPVFSVLQRYGCGLSSVDGQVVVLISKPPDYPARSLRCVLFQRSVCSSQHRDHRGILHCFGLGQIWDNSKVVCERRFAKCERVATSGDPLFLRGERGIRTPRYGFDTVHRFSKPAPSAARPSLHKQVVSCQ